MQHNNAMDPNRICRPPYCFVCSLRLGHRGRYVPMPNLNTMRLIFSTISLPMVVLLAGCNANNESVALPPAAVAKTDKDDLESVTALNAINAETKTNDSGFITFIDVSERDDISDDMFRHFSGLPHLKEFHAIYTPISGKGLKHLADAKSLETLDLYGCAITDASVNTIASMKSLRSLNLIGSKITDASIETLSQFQSLEYLGIGDTQITESGRNRLAEALPDNCELD